MALSNTLSRIFYNIPITFYFSFVFESGFYRVIEMLEKLEFLEYSSIEILCIKEPNFDGLTMVRKYNRIFQKMH